jgi:hypothetical protein
MTELEALCKRLREDA